MAKKDFLILYPDQNQEKDQVDIKKDFQKMKKEIIRNTTDKDDNYER